MLSTLLMHHDQRITAGFVAAISLIATQAAAQPAPTPAEPPAPAPPETLETPYQDTPAAPVPPPAPAPPPPPASAPAPPPTTTAPAPAEAQPLIAETPADTRPLLPIRAQRRLTLTGEIGWNGLAGFGPVLTYHVHPHFSADLGLGLSLMGWKAGVRGRYNLLKTPLTPFVGLGFNATTGLGEITTNAADDPNRDPERDPVTMNVKASYLVQGVVGIDYVHRRGFTLVGCVGWAHLLNKKNLEVLAGELTEDEERGFNIAFKGGLVITVATGYAFQ